MTERNRAIRVKRLHDPDEDDLARTTAEERIGMMWQLALDAWAFRGEPVAEPRLQRQVVRVIRREVTRTAGATQEEGEQHGG